MRTLLTFVGLMGLSAVLIVLGVILGDYASWYFASIVGTAMLVLVSAAGLAWLDAHDAERDQHGAEAHQADEGQQGANRRNRFSRRDRCLRSHGRRRCRA